jgi:hypothetical protein
MLSFIWGQLRGRAGRSVALLAGVLVATSGFVVLTGATTASRLNVTGSIERNTRPRTTSWSARRGHVRRWRRSAGWSVPTTSPASSAASRPRSTTR